jgi:hypothetical protein
MQKKIAFETNVENKEMSKKGLRIISRCCAFDEEPSNVQTHGTD